MSEPSNDKQCILCNRNEHQIPLLSIDYQAAKLWICPQHLPVLIHDPAQLIGKLPGAENLKPADIHD